MIAICLASSYQDGSHPIWNLDDHRYLQTLIDLNSNSIERRRAGAIRSQKMKSLPVAVVNQLVSCLQSKDVELQIGAVVALEKSSDDIRRIVVNSTLKTIKFERDTEIRQRFIRSIGRYGDTASSAVPVLIDIMSATDSYEYGLVVSEPWDLEGNESEATVAAYSLTKIGSASIAPLLRLFDDSKLPVQIRTSAGGALLVLAERFRLPLTIIRNKATDDNVDVRFLAVKLLTIIDQPISSKSRTCLSAALDDKHDRIRIVAAAALVRAGDRGGRNVTGVPVLIQIARNTTSSDREEAILTLGLLGEHASPAVNDLTLLLSDVDTGVRAQSTTALGRIGPKAKSALPSLQFLLKDKDDDIRSRAIKAIKSIDVTNQK